MLCTFDQYTAICISEDLASESSLQIFAGYLYSARQLTLGLTEYKGEQEIVGKKPGFSQLKLQEAKNHWPQAHIVVSRLRLN